MNTDKSLLTCFFHKLPSYPFLAVACCFLYSTPLLPAQGQNNTESPDDGSEVLTRGPVHEAFAGTITYNPEAGLLAPTEPPAAIEEQPPELKPEGTNVVWISGYWAWDEERKNFIWVSGVWRDIPPGRQWIPGYWNSTDSGFQWISGYWANSGRKQPEYLPEPPVTLESGPNIEAPSEDYIWVPGVWVWQGRYVWRPGYWIVGRPDLAWTPDTYVWTPRGCIYVGGYWDYPVTRRGVLFAPVYWEQPVYVRRNYYYRPAVVINLSIFSDCLFVRPRYHHYYFGDYYSPNYGGSGFFVSINFNSRRRGYDPIFCHQRWEHRRDRDWEKNYHKNYEARRDNESARPPRNFAEQNKKNPSGQQSQDTGKTTLIASPLKEVADNPKEEKRFRKISSNEKAEEMKKVEEVRTVSTNRQKEEKNSRSKNRGDETVQNAATAIDSTEKNTKQGKDPTSNRDNKNTTTIPSDSNETRKQADKSEKSKTPPWKNSADTEKNNQVNEVAKESKKNQQDYKDQPEAREKKTPPPYQQQADDAQKRRDDAAKELARQSRDLEQKNQQQARDLQKQVERQAQAQAQQQKQLRQQQQSQEKKQSKKSREEKPTATP